MNLSSDGQKGQQKDGYPAAWHIDWLPVHQYPWSPDSEEVTAPSQGFP
jgi:hypothetical protein